MFLGIEEPIKMLIFSLVINGGVIFFCIYKEYSLETTLGSLVVIGMLLGIYSILAFIMAAFIIWLYYIMGKELVISVKNWFGGSNGTK